MQNSKDFDTINSIYILWIAYEGHWESHGIKQGAVNYYLRYIRDKNYDANVTEINRCINLLSQRLTLEYLEQYRPMSRAILYRNQNRGRSIQGVQNTPLFRIECKGGFMHKQPQIFQQNMTQKELMGWIQLLKRLEDFSKQNQALAPSF